MCECNVTFLLSLETTTNRQSTSSSAIGILENQSKEEIENDIYYHRELLIKSIEGRRVDLLTITSFHNIQKEHEYTFPDLFPDPLSKRCRKFKNKKVFHLAALTQTGVVMGFCSYIRSVLGHFYIITSSSR